MAIDWELGDIVYFLSVARAGSTLGGAQKLGVNQTTCARRIAALESALGVRLFDRNPSGYALTDAGRALLSSAEAIEASGDAFADMAGAIRRVGAGVIRVTAVDSIADLLLAPVASRFHALHPEVCVEIAVSGDIVDLRRGEADIAIRAGVTPNDPQLVRRRLPDSLWALYATQDYVDRHGMPTFSTILTHGVATLDGAPRDAAIALGVNIVHVTNTIGALIAIVRGHGCVGAIPCVAGHAAADLIRCFDFEASELWLVYPERLRGIAPVRALIDAIVAQAELLRPALTGVARG
jgi:DNA-binding transcriptional LysR family regulator